MDMIPVVSSNLHSVGYAGSTLRISFNSGWTYDYYDVPPNVYEGLMNASSKGTYHKNFIKNSYKYRRVG